MQLREGQVLRYGYDHALGWFGEVLDRHGDEVAAYDRLRASYERARPLRGLLEWMSRTTGVYTLEDLDDALGRVIHDTPAALPERLQTVAEIIHNLQHVGRS